MKKGDSSNQEVIAKEKGEKKKKDERKESWTPVKREPRIEVRGRRGLGREGMSLEGGDKPT